MTSIGPYKNSHRTLSPSHTTLEQIVRPASVSTYRESEDEKLPGPAVVPTHPSLQDPLLGLGVLQDTRVFSLITSLTGLVCSGEYLTKSKEK